MERVEHEIENRNERNPDAKSEHSDAGNEAVSLEMYERNDEGGKRKADLLIIHKIKFVYGFRPGKKEVVSLMVDGKQLDALGLAVGGEWKPKRSLAASFYGQAYIQLLSKDNTAAPELFVPERRSCLSEDKEGLHIKCRGVIKGKRGTPGKANKNYLIYYSVNKHEGEWSELGNFMMCGSNGCRSCELKRVGAVIESGEYYRIRKEERDDPNREKVCPRGWTDIALKEESRGAICKRSFDGY